MNHLDFLELKARAAFSVLEGKYPILDLGQLENEFVALFKKELTISLPMGVVPRLKPLTEETSLNEVGLSTNTFNLLWREGIKIISDLGKYTESELLRKRGIGPYRLGLIKQELADHGLALGEGLVGAGK